MAIQVVQHKGVCFELASPTVDSTIDDMPGSSRYYEKRRI